MATRTLTDFEQLESIIERYFPDKFDYLKIVLAAGYSTLFINDNTTQGDPN